MWVLLFFVVFIGSFSPALFSYELRMELEIPEIKSSQYRRPYLAIWLEEKLNWRENQTLTLWYDDDQWLKDVRRWWRKVGRYTKPVDGFSGATKKPGRYAVSKTVNLKSEKAYILYFEAVREHGNRTLLKHPLSDIVLGEPIFVDAGDELGPITITLSLP